MLLELTEVEMLNMKAISCFGCVAAWFIWQVLNLLVFLCNHISLIHFCE